MQEIKRIVIPVDRSDASKLATEQGAHLAKLLGVDVVVLSIDDSQQFMASVILEEKIRKENETIIEEFKKIAEAREATVHTQIIKGTNPADEIVKFTNEEDLIVMASRNRKGLDKFVLGSVSEEVLRCALCPVMVIKPHLSKENHNL